MPTAANRFKLIVNNPGGWPRLAVFTKVMSAAALLHKVVRSVRLASALHTAHRGPLSPLVHTFQILPLRAHQARRLRSQMFWAVVRIFRVPERGKCNKVMSVEGLLIQST